MLFIAVMLKWLLYESNKNVFSTTDTVSWFNKFHQNWAAIFCLMFIRHFIVCTLWNIHRTKHYYRLCVCDTSIAISLQNKQLTKRRFPSICGAVCLYVNLFKYILNYNNSLSVPHYRKTKVGNKHLDMCIHFCMARILEKIYNG